MTPERYQRIKSIFFEAAGTRGRARLAVLDRACGPDTDLRHEVEKLLAGQESATSEMDGLVTPEDFNSVRREIEHLAAGSSAAAPIPSSLAGVGELPQVAGYTIERLIGSGGMGTVYAATQKNPRRTVALKVMRAGVASKAALRRFEFEAQVLAHLRHPGIAQIYEAGTFRANGAELPFFAMEYIPDAVPLTDYAVQHRFTTRARLSLFAAICDAVHYGHQKGVIHRDIKPSNVLVDAGGAIKVIDFGVARAVDSDLAVTTLHTDTGQLIGTLQYMSPEQVAWDTGDIDTRSDVYALGVVLYELLCGNLPYDLHGVSIVEAGRLIREHVPAKLSTLDRRLRGDVETIVLKALEKERERRYPSAAEFAQDVRRYLSGEAIQARPASALYHLRVFARRNKLAFGSIAAAFVGLLAASIVSTSLYLRADADRQRAEQAEGQADLARLDEKAAKEAAIASGNVTRKVADFQADMLADINSAEAGISLMDDIEARFETALDDQGLTDEERSEKLHTFRELLGQVNATDTAAAMIDRVILERAVRAIDAEFAEQPEVHAALRQTLAGVYRSLGLFDVALPLQEQALTARRELLGSDHEATLDSIRQMGVLLQGQGRASEAEDYFREGLEHSQRLASEDEAATVQWIGALGGALYTQGRLNEAEPYLRRSLDIRRERFGDEHPDTALAINDLGVLLRAQGKLAEAEPLLRESLELNRRLKGDHHGNTLHTINNLGSVLFAQGRLDEAEPLWREVLERTRRVFGEQHPETLTALNNLGMLLSSQGKPAEAEPLLHEALDKTRRMLGDDHPNTLSAIGNMGIVLHDLGRLDEAEAYYREALEKKRALLGPHHPEFLISVHNLGVFLQKRGRLAEAETQLREALDGLREVQGDDHASTQTTISCLGWVLRSAGRPAEGEPYIREALEWRRRSLGAAHPDTVTSVDNLAFTLQDLGRLAEAEPLFRELVTAFRANAARQPAPLASRLLDLGMNLARQQKFEEAEPLIRECLKIRDRLAPSGDWRRHYIRSVLGEVLCGVGKFEEAEATLLDAWEHLKDDPAVPRPTPTHDLKRDAQMRIARLYEVWHQADPEDGHEASAAKWQAALTAGP